MSANFSMFATNPFYMKIKPGEAINILLADDDEDDRELFAEIINKVNGPVKLIHSDSGYDLFSKINAWEGDFPHILFLDLNMPGKDGRVCLAEIKKNNLLNKLHIIICSTSASPDDIDFAYNKGADLYIVKPNKFNVYFSILKNVLGLFLDNKLPVKDRKNFVFA